MQVPAGGSSSWLAFLLLPLAYALYEEVASQVVKAGVRCVARVGRLVALRIKPTRSSRRSRVAGTP